MIVDKAGEVIVDILTMSPSLAKIPSASAILDTSNYTFQAISYGKDASGFNYHAHAQYNPTLSAIVVKSYEATSVSSYHSSAIASALYFYNLLPSYPDPLNTRLEPESCLTFYSGLGSFSGLDIGHCANHAILSQYSSNYITLGCFPPSGGVKYIVVKPSHDDLNFNQSNLIYSGTLSGNYNKYGLMDSSGFLTFAPLNGSQGNQNTALLRFTSGVLINLSPNFSSTGYVDIAWHLSGNDAASLLLYGGVYQLGLWCLDIRAMLKEGHKPPFNFNPLNNIRKYRLFAKKTFSRDLLYLNDVGGSSGMKNLLESSALVQYLVYQWTIRFL